MIKEDGRPFGFCPGQLATDIFFPYKDNAEVVHGEEIGVSCFFVDLEKAFRRIPKKDVQWALIRSEMV